MTEGSAPHLRTMRRVLSFLARIAGWPFRLPFNAWFRNLNHKVEESRREFELGLDALSRRITDLESGIHKLENIGREVQDSVRVDTETIAELSLAVERIVAQADQRIEVLTERLGEDAMRRLVGQPIAELPAAGAHLVNWANGAIGMAGEAGLWINHGVNLMFAEGGARIEGINERVVELPFALAAATRIPTAGNVLDVGATESLLALQLAGLGYKVTAIDPRPYPFHHPNLTVITEVVEHWGGPTDEFDAIFCVSTVEHLGLGHYVPASNQDDLDRFVMKLMATWLAPSGFLVLTIPCGRWSMDEFQRVYDREHLDELLTGWSIEEQRVFVQTDPRTWTESPTEVLNTSWSHEGNGVALFRLRLAT